MPSVRLLKYHCSKMCTNKKQKYYSKIILLPELPRVQVLVFKAVKTSYTITDNRTKERLCNFPKYSAPVAAELKTDLDLKIFR